MQVRRWACIALGMDYDPRIVKVGDPLLDSVLAGKYHLLEAIGGGAMGRVYRARHLDLDAFMAVKVLSPELSSDAQTIRRFHHEARAVSRLRHPNTIRIHDFGQGEGGVLYLAMELLHGRTLGQALRSEGPLPAGRIARLLGPALSALDEAHQAEVIHRDFKPDNIFIEQLRSGDEHIKVLDFGIAKVQGLGESGITRAGSVCGTPDYMSPEQIRGDDLDARSDVYAAGVVLYELLTGGRPFEGALLEVLTRHLSQPPQPPRRRRPDLPIPAALERIALKALSKRREDRYASAAEMERALRQAAQALSGQPCPTCGEVVPARIRFCPWCGAALGSAATRLSLARREGGPELPRWPDGLYGRDEVLRRLSGLDRRAVLLAGPSGVGKTRLCEAWTQRLSGSRPLVLVQPDASTARTPLYPVRAALAQGLGISQRPGLAELDLSLRRLSDGAALDRPGLCELFGVWEAATSSPYDVRRRECFAAAVQTLRRLPCVFIFEDVERYDGPSRGVLARLCQDPGQATVLMTGDGPRIFASSKESENTHVPPEIIALSPLPDEVVRTMALPPRVVAAGRGVPRDLELAYRALSEGVVIEAGATAERMVGARLALLPDDARALLEALAVLGTQAPVGLASELAGLNEVKPVLQELVQRGLLRVYGELLELPSPSLRDLVHGCIESARRRSLHRQSYQLLEGRGAGPAVLAHHALQAAPDGVPLPVLERAGDTARGSFDDEAAERWFQLAWAQARRLVQSGQAVPEVQVQAGLRLALTLRYAGKIIEAEQMLREVLSLSGGDARAEADARRGLARLAYAWDQPAAAQQELYAAIRAAWQAGDPGLLCELYLELADVLARSGDRAGAERELREGIDSVTSGDGLEAEHGPHGLWRLLLRLAELIFQDRRAPRLAEALVVGRHALRWAVRAATPEARSRTQKFLGLLHKALGEPQVAARYHKAALEEARLCGDRRSTAEILIVMADTIQEADQTPQSRGSARALLLEASTLSQQIGWGEGVRLAQEQMDEQGQGG